MNILTWNIRGIGNSPSQKHLHSFCLLHKIKNSGHHGTETVANCSNKIWCFIDFDFDMEILIDHEQLLHMRIHSQLLPAPFLFTYIYAKCDIASRRELWEDLRQIVDQYSSQPWLLGGDFNTILRPKERTGQKDRRMTSQNDFSNMILDYYGLIDAGYEGSTFTWTNNKIWKRLDRILYSEDWLNLFHMTKVSHLPRIWSDHSPLLISMSMNLAKSPPSFRFLRMWTRHHSFWEILKQLLRWWNKNVFGDIFENIKKAKQEAVIREQKFEDDPSDTNLIELKRCTAVLTHALTVEEGERNIKFFYSLVKKKRSKSRVHSITHEGIHLTDQEEIKQSAA
ncbi:hypothetical protein Pfo_020884 [Paulownia fortunei]|nr:hypothetical protein Pfo_020884 [Paulownia fortunei]